MKPQRIQRKRTKGWRMPDNTVYVGRGSRWGNPFVVEKDGDAKECVRKYSEMLIPYRHQGETNSLHDFYISSANIDAIRTELNGKNLACWCKIGSVCHADVLLEIAN